MDDIREHQTNEDVSSEKPPADEEIRKTLLELKLIPTKWEQNLFNKRWLPIAMLIPIGGLFLIGLVEDTYYYLEYFRNRGMSFQLFKSYFSLDGIYVSFALLVMVLVCLFQRFVKQAPRALYRLWRNRVISPRTVTGDTDATSTLVDFLTRYEAALLDPKRFLLSSLTKSYRAKSYEVVPVKQSDSIISRQAGREKGNAS
jgi:hypothetical protein